jgi:hypothetical protein
VALQPRAVVADAAPFGGIMSAADGKRPGGLTALAVLNFVFGGLGALGLLALFAVIGAATTAIESQGGTVTPTAGAGVLWINLLLALVVVGLMITSGVGYLGQKRFLGRTLGNAYAITSLAQTGVSLALAGTAFGMAAIIGLVYPVLTLALLNTTFKDDLVN